MKEANNINNENFTIFHFYKIQNVYFEPYKYVSFSVKKYFIDEHFNILDIIKDI